MALLAALMGSGLAAQPSAAEEKKDGGSAPGAGRRPLKQILIAEGLEAAQKLTPTPGGGFLVLAPPIAPIHQKELSTRLAAAENRLIDEPLLAAIAQVVEVYFKQNDLPVATALVPPQSIADGAIRVALLPGKIRNIKFEGNRWFSEKLLRTKLRIEEGVTLRLSAIDQSLNWTNANSFRNVRVHLQPVAETGEVDLYIGVTEQAPWRTFASFDNSGNELLGEKRLTLGATAGNLWGRDHQFSYQFITSDFTSVFRAHTFDYRMPLPWRHWLSLSGSMLDANPSFFDGLITQKGRSLTGDLRYSMSFRRKRWRLEATAGLSAKQTNNNLEYGGTPVLGSTTDSFALVLSGAAVRDDPRGRFVFGATLTGSPGEINSRNSELLFNESRLGAKPRFGHIQLSMERLTRLIPNTASILRISGQKSSGNMVPAEQYSIGGSNTVRGYKERLLSGDHGYMATHELHRKLFSAKLPKKLPELETSAIAFWDYGRTIIHRPELRQRKSDYLSSAGLGLRVSIANTLSASLDHAWQLERVELPGEKHYRTHFRIMLSY